MDNNTGDVEALRAEITALRAQIAEMQQQATLARSLLEGQTAQACATAEAAATERARFHALLMDIPAAIVLLTGPEMVAELANSLYLTLIGRDDIVGKPIREFLPELVEQGFLDLLLRVYESGESFIGREIPVRLDRQRNGEMSDGWFTFIYQPVREPDGTKRGVLAHVIEVTEQVLARRELQAEVQERKQTAQLLQAEIQERVRTEEDLRSKLGIIQQQEEAILALTTPILQIWEGVLALPVVGMVDSIRAGRMMEGLLNAIARTQTRFAVLDLTGVQILDSHAADHLLKLIRAAGLLGSRCLVSGVSPQMAQTIVALNLDLVELMTFNTLESALRHAIRHLDEPGNKAPKAPAKQSR